MISALQSDSNYLKLKEPAGAHQGFCLKAIEYTHTLFRDICNNIRILKGSNFLSSFVFVTVHRKLLCTAYSVTLY